MRLLKSQTVVEQEVTLPAVNPRPGGEMWRLAHGKAMDVFGCTDAGCVRDVNEDQFLVADLERWMLIQHTSLPLARASGFIGGAQGKVMAVADGIGGHGGGDQASAIAVDALVQYLMYEMPWFLAGAGRGAGDLGGELAPALHGCQERLRRFAARRGLEHHRMGTTLTAAYLAWPILWVVHAGASRCYLLRDGELRQLTSDHTVAQRLFEIRAIDRAEYESSPLRHVLFNAIGGGTDDLAPEIHRAELEDGDAILLCTDGLTRHLSDEEIAEHLRGARSASSGCARLVGAAKAAGGIDNVTVVIARC